MMTASFTTAFDHPNAVAIVRYLPRWRRFAGRIYQDLAPSRKALSMKREADYDVLFDQQLAQLDPRKVYADLGPDAALLCYEPAGFKCHRRRVAEWLEQALGIEIPELGVPRSETPAYAESPLKPKPAPKRQTSFLRLLLHGAHLL